MHINIGNSVVSPRTESNVIYVQSSAHFVGEQRENEFPRLEHVEDSADDVQIGILSDVGLEANVGELGFRSDVNGHVFALRSAEWFKLVTIRMHK